MFVGRATPAASGKNPIARAKASAYRRRKDSDHEGMAGAARSGRGGQDGRRDGSRLARRRPRGVVARACRARSVAGNLGIGDARRRDQSGLSVAPRRARPGGQASEPRRCRARDRAVRRRSHARRIDPRRQNDRQSEDSPAPGARGRPGHAQYAGCDRPRRHRRLCQPRSDRRAAPLVRDFARRDRSLLLARGGGSDRRRDGDIGRGTRLCIRTDGSASWRRRKDWACRRSSP